MTYEGCNGNKGPAITEKLCPNCGNPVEITSQDAYVVCDKCGFKVFNDLMSCVHYCPKAKECVGEELYAKLMAMRDEWTEEMNALQDEDEW